MRFKNLLSVLTDNTLKWWFPLSLFLHISAAYLSTGFHHVDEHYQILEFLHNKLHLTNPITYPWEFAEKMRPWLQPFVYYYISKTLYYFNVTNPFTLAFVFRLISALVGFWNIFLWVKYIKENFKNKNTILFGIIFLNFLWFTPYLHARISGETLGASALSIGLYLILKALKTDKIFNYLSAGFILGLSVILRYHIAIIVLSLIAWLIILKKVKFKYLSFLGLGLIFAFGLSLLIDFWGYKEWTLAPLNYFRSNILNNKASQFGISPWYEYFFLVIAKSFAPIGVITLGAWGVFCSLKPRHFITWLTIPFFLVHVFIPHKELRFLFPLTIFIPLVCTVLFNEYSNHFSKRLQSPLFKSIVAFIFLINLFLLMFNTFLRAHPSEGFYEHLFSQNNRNRTYVLYDEDSFFHPGIYSNNFYNPDHTNVMELQDMRSIKGNLKLNEVWFISWDKKSYLDLVATSGCTVEYKSQPDWYIKLPLKETKIWAIIHCKKKGAIAGP